jgi:hypothetical protein
MRLALVSFLAALVAAPLAAQAAQPSTTWAVTLRGTVTDNYEYSESRVDERRCRIRRIGMSGRRLVFQSARATRIQVARAEPVASYRPARLRAVRITAGNTGGSVTQTKFCTGEPLERTRVECRATRAAPRLVRLGFRARRTTITFARPSRLTTSVCGLTAPQPAGWLHIAAARASHGALVAGRSRRVFVFGEATEEVRIPGPPLEIVRKTTVRWTLTFRRVG